MGSVQSCGKPSRPLVNISTPLGNMRGWVSVEEDPVMKVWTLILQEQGLKYDKQALLTLLTLSKNHRLDITEAATLDLRTWEWIGRFIIEATSTGDKASISVIEPWRFTVLRHRTGRALCGCSKPQCHTKPLC